MKKNSIAFTFSAFSTITEDGTISNKIVNVPKVINYSKLLKNTIIGCLTVVIDREKVGDFRMPDIRAGQDTATWLSILKKGYEAHGIQTPLAMYRKVSGSVSSNKWKSLKRTWNIYKNIEEIPFLKLVYYYSFYVFNASYKRIFKY